MEEGDAIEDDQPLCIHCAKPYNGLDHFCPHCSGPVSQHSAVDPMGQVFAMGHAYSSATSGRFSKLVLIGMWVLFGPQLVLLLVLDVGVSVEMLLPTDQMSAYDSGPRIDAASQAEAYFKLVVMFALTAFYGTLLYKVTAGYIRKRKEYASRSLDEA